MCQAEQAFLKEKTAHVVCGNKTRVSHGGTHQSNDTKSSFHDSDIDLIE